MQHQTKLHAAPRVAVLSILLIALGCAPTAAGSTDPLAGGNGRGRRRDAGTTVADSGGRDAAPPLTADAGRDAGRDTGPVATDAGRDTGPVATDAGSPVL